MSQVAIFWDSTVGGDDISMPFKFLPGKNASGGDERIRATERGVIPY